jgi:hypothetical protein
MPSKTALASDVPEQLAAMLCSGHERRAHAEAEAVN